MYGNRSWSIKCRKQQQWFIYSLYKIKKDNNKQCPVRIKVASIKLVFEGLRAFCQNIPKLSVGYVYSLGRFFFHPTQISQPWQCETSSETHGITNTCSSQRRAIEEPRPEESPCIWRESGLMCAMHETSLVCFFTGGGGKISTVREKERRKAKCSGCDVIVQPYIHLFKG